MSIKILLADNDSDITKSLSARFRKEKGMAVIAEADTGYRLFELLQMHSPNILIYDINMDGQRGLDILKEVIKRHNGIRTIVFTENKNGDTIRDFFQQGGNGYLLKSCPFEELLTAIRTVRDGGLFLCPDLGGHLMNEVLTISAPHLESALLKKLSSREIEVFRLIKEGKTAKEIAALLHISEGTVKTHKKHIMEKLEVHNMIELIRKTLFTELE